MNMLNSMIMEGNITKDVEIKTNAQGLSCAEFEIETKRVYRKADGTQAEESSFFPVCVFGNMADFIGKNGRGKAGQSLRVVGRLKQERWEQDGKKFSKIVVIAEHIEFKPTPKKKEAENAQ